jgi:ectoine hydroxylase-related dioxygenase (phytanoyl-CoA dioxygenase family)
MTNPATATAEATLPPATLFPARELLASDSVGGLVPLHGRVIFAAPLARIITLDVAVQDRQASFPIAPAECHPLAEGGCYYDYLLVLNTFLLAEGPQQIVLGIPECPNARAALALTVRNDSPLGGRTGRAIAQHPGSRWIWREGDIDSTHFPMADPDVFPWFDRPGALDMTASIAARDGLDCDEAQSLRDFVEHGYCVLPYRVDDALLERLNRDLDRMLAQGEIAVADEAMGDHRVELIHEKSSAAREIWTLAPVMKFLRSVFQEEVLPCQTLVFIRGSGQAKHQDTIHLTAFPAGYMCGVWIALEDVQADAGPLIVYPGSHRLPRLYCATVDMGKVRDGNWTEYAQNFLPRLESELARAGLQEHTYLPRRGDILVWHENLTHGGSTRNNPALSRRSIVSHYFSRGAAVWYDTSGRCGSTRIIDTSENRRALRSVLRVARGVLNGSSRLQALKTLWRMH